MRTEPTRRVRELRNVWIPLSDGTRLSARIWLPEDAEDDPVPALLEYLPYRKDDATAARDAVRHPYLAGHGYASVRVDMRGSGDSDGLLLDEYLPQEQLDARRGDRVARRAAVVLRRGRHVRHLLGRLQRAPGGCAPTARAEGRDRRLDDTRPLHGRRSLVRRMRVPADARVGDDDARLQRAAAGSPRSSGSAGASSGSLACEGSRPFIETWLGHQRRDGYWLQGSVDEDYAGNPLPGLRRLRVERLVPEPGLRAARGARRPAKGLIGPWAHTYPEQACRGRRSASCRRRFAGGTAG